MATEGTIDSESDAACFGFQAAFEAVPHGVVILDDAQCIVWCNSTAAVHLDLDPQGDKGQRLTNLIRDPALVAALQLQVPSEAVRIGTHRPEQTLMLQVRPYAANRRLVLSHDVTESDRMELMRRDFVAHVSHEIRTPLTVLAGFVETLQTLALEQDEREHVLELMRQQTHRMEALVSDLLVLAHLEAQPKPGIEHWTPLDPLVRSTVADTALLSNGQHRFSIEALPPVEVAVEAKELTSALGNLVSNAIRYTPPGGHVVIGSAWRSDSYLELRVQDNGIGIERQHLPRITQRFYRVERSRSRHTGGTGLGLAIVKHAINRHGGELLIDSQPGVGSTFTLTLPPSRVRMLGTTEPASFIQDSRD